MKSFLRSFSRTIAGISENFVARIRKWGFELEGWELHNKGPVYFIADENDDVDPLFVQRFLASRVKNSRVLIRSSDHGHWHYWAHYEEQLEQMVTHLKKDGLLM
jgi:pimeloyl-ACP methyl ester carboxylesterase